MYDHAWRAYSRRRLAEFPWCVTCLQRRNQLVQATITDHIVPHKGSTKLFLDQANHQSLCKTCHDRKTATEDGGGWR